MIHFRHPVEADRSILTTWIAYDPEHSQGGMTPDFFFTPGTLPMVIGDAKGPGLYVRLDSEPPDTVRLHIQFGPDEVRSGKTLLRAWPEFKERVKAAGVRRMVYESSSPRLIGFCARCFGFRRVSDTSNDYELVIED